MNDDDYASPKAVLLRAADILSGEAQRARDEHRVCGHCAATAIGAAALFNDKDSKPALDHFIQHHGIPAEQGWWARRYRLDPNESQSSFWRIALWYDLSCCDPTGDWLSGAEQGAAAMRAAAETA